MEINPPALLIEFTVLMYSSNRSARITASRRIWLLAADSGAGKLTEAKRRVEVKNDSDDFVPQANPVPTE